MGNINRVPSGLLGLLDGQVLGKNPDELLGTIQSGLDLTELFLANTTLKAATSTAGSVMSASTVAPVEVPVGEIWFIVAGGVTLTRNGGTGSIECMFYPVVTNVLGDVTASRVPLNRSIGDGFPALFPSNGDVYVQHLDPIRPLILKAPTQISCRIDGVSGLNASWNITTRVAYYSLTI